MIIKKKSFVSAHTNLSPVSRKRGMKIFGGKSDGRISNQKRDFYRLSCHIPTTFTLLRTNDFGWLTATESFRCVVCDLSGNGVKIITATEMSLHDRIFISLHLEGAELFLTGEIRTKRLIPNAGYNIQYGITFNGISDVEQDKIVRYLYRQQTQRPVLSV